MEVIERGVIRRQETMNKRKLLPAVAGFFIASAAVAAEQILPSPPPSEFVDTESSVNVPLPTDEGRRIRLTLAFEPTPTNAVQLAFGNDLNGSENLEPEEAELVVGCDCGEWFVRKEVVSEFVVGSWPEAVGGNQLPATNALTTCFSIKQPRERWDLAKVTTHNLADTNLIVTAEFYNRGKVLFLR